MALMACSGFDGPPAALAQNIATANDQAAVAAALCVASLALFAVKPRRWVMPALLLALLALHPAWTIGAEGGDCGFLMRDVSWCVTGFGVIVLCWQLACILWSWTFPSPPIEPATEGSPSSARDG
jgi:hypothetical protein